MNTYKQQFLKGWLGGMMVVATCGAGSAWAADVTGLTTFNSGDPLSAATMNGNFSAVKSAVDDNNGRISTIEGQNLNSRLQTLEGQNLDSRVTSNTQAIQNLQQGGGACVGNDTNDIMVRVGPLCIDKYEASVWTAKTGGTRLDGTYSCDPRGGDCGSIYAQSRQGVQPSTTITWFQAQQACANAGKRLLTNAEWQMAAAGGVVTSCNTNTAGKVNAGAGGANCQSRHAVADMVGNVWEWVADWMQGGNASWAPLSGPNATVDGAGGDDIMAGVNPAPIADFTTDPGTYLGNYPAALIRGGAYNNGVGAGRFALEADHAPIVTRNVIGFRCAR